MNPLLLAATESGSAIAPAIYLAGVLLLGMLSQWAAWRLRIPAIVLLLATGFVVGNFVRPQEFIDTELLFPVVSLSVGIILFEGGLSLRFREVRETGLVVMRLVTIGLFITWVGSALAAWSIVGFSPPMAVLIGALLTVSGPTVILPLLRHVRPSRRIGSVVKWEGIVNDPIGAVLAALVFEAIARGSGESFAAESFLGMGKTAFVGVALGSGTAWALLQLFRRYLVPDYLQNGLVLAIVLTIFAVSNQLQHEAGLVTVTIMGVILANQRSVSIRHIVEFKENLRVLLISALFIVLASRVQIDADTLRRLDWTAWDLVLRGGGFVLVLMLVIRPLSVLAATIFSGLKWKERVFLAWIHPRGIVAAAVASLFALNLANTPEAAVEGELLVLITFLVIVGTVTIYGLTLGPLARLLGLSNQNPQGVLFAGASPPVREIASALKEEGVYAVLVDNNPQNIATARMAGLGVLYASIGSEYAREELDLGDLGRLLAMTPNDEVNALAAMEFVEHFGRAAVYQLSPPETGNERQERVSPDRRGRMLFKPSVTFQQLADRFRAGARVKKTLLTEDFTFRDFSERYPRAIVMFCVDSSKRTLVLAADSELEFTAGMKLIALVDEPEDESLAPKK